MVLYEGGYPEMQIPEQKSPSFKTGPIGNRGLIPFGVGHSESRRQDGTSVQE